MSAWQGAEKQPCSIIRDLVPAEKSTKGALFRHLAGLDTSVTQFPHLENVLPLQGILDTNAWQGRMDE